MTIKKKSPVITGDGSVKHGAHSFDEGNARKELAYMIILHEYPLSMVDHLGFKRFCNSLQPLFKAIASITIKRDIMKVFESSSIQDNDYFLFLETLLCNHMDYN